MSRLEQDERAQLKHRDSTATALPAIKNRLEKHRCAAPRKRPAGPRASGCAQTPPCAADIRPAAPRRTPLPARSAPPRQRTAVESARPARQLKAAAHTQLRWPDSGRRDILCPICPSGVPRRPRQGCNNSAPSTAVVSHLHLFHLQADALLDALPLRHADRDADTPVTGVPGVGRSACKHQSWETAERGVEH